MQVLQQTMAHRGAGATRTNARWHPYTPPRSAGASTPNYVPPRPSSSQINPPQSADFKYLITPASSVYSTSPASTSFAISPPRSSLSASQLASSQVARPQLPTKTPAKVTYVATLVDQAVKSLTDIWRPDTIPAVFATSTRITVAKPPTPIQTQRQPITRCHSLQLPSPCSPTTQSSPLPPSDLSRSTSSFIGEHFGDSATVVTEKDLVPIKTFVHEVLRRSRTTCSVLQSALCYIEAIRKKVPELVDQERRGLGVRGEPELGERVVKEDEDQSLSDLTTSIQQLSANNGDLFAETMTLMENSDSIPTVLQCDASLPSSDGSQDAIDVDNALKRRKVPAKPLSPLPPLPSPLLCPRRAFLAALILASKFLQDRCYSNRAWAKLSGLPPREVGRCERALGEALEWRLWVGKGAALPEENKRSVTRSRSEGSISLTTPYPNKSTSQIPSPPMSDAGASPEFGRSLCPLPGQARSSPRNLRRAATLPDESAFRSIPPRYRQHGSLPFAFQCPLPAALAAPQANALAPQPTLPYFGSFGPVSQPLTGLSSDWLSLASSLGPEQPTPRLSFSPASGEFNLDTPNTQYSSGAWSPAQSTGSNDSSDSGSSVGSIATPPNMQMRYSSADAALCAFAAGKRSSGDVDYSTSVTTSSFGASDPALWYAQVLSAGAGAFAPEHSQISMLDVATGEICGQA